MFVPAESTAATLQHHYKLDGGAADDLGITNLSVQGNSVVFNASGGAAAGYLRLGGSDDYLLASLDAGSTFSLLGDYGSFRPFSVSFWVRQTVAQAGSGTQAVFGITTNSTSSATFNTGFEVITREGSAGRGLRVRARQGGSGSNEGEISTGQDISDGSWHHVVVAFDEGNRSVYIDGAFRGINSTPVPVTTNPLRYFAVGAFLRAGSILDDFNGDIDDLQVYGGMVTGDEALWLCQNPGEPLPGEVPPVSLAPVDLVDTLIGAEDTGSCVPGACLPQSSIYPSPDTLAVSPSGYKAGSPIVGFAQLHAQGAGASTPSFGNFLVSPRLGAGINESDHASGFSNVRAKPYSYRTRLTAWNTECTVVPAANSAIYQFDFPASADARLNFDVARKLGRSDGMTSGSVAINAAAGTISGGGTFDGNWAPGSYNLYFYAKVDRLPTGGGTFVGTTSGNGVMSASTSTRQRLGGWMTFDTTTARTVRMKIAVSFVSVDQARAHLEREIPAWDLTGLEEDGREKWQQALSVVLAPGIGVEEGRKLYTSLFHSLVQPRDRTLDAPVGWPTETPYWDDQYTLWDTWLTLYPLLTIIKPDAIAANVNAFAGRFARNGKAETAFIQGKDFASGQGGDEVDAVIADALVKGVPGINWDDVWPLMRFNAGRRTDDYRNLGFVSYDGSIGVYDSRMKSGSSTLAFAYHDWCAAQVGFARGHTAEAQALLTRSRNWRNVWDTTASGDGFSGFVRGRYRNGTFRTSIPTSTSDFYQGTGWNYSFNVPHERDAMIDLSGGRARFLQRLEFAFGKNSNSYVDFTNEPCFQTLWLFSHAGRPYLASSNAALLRQKFGAYSFPGDEDSGAMSSLYFFLTAGFFPISGQDIYYLHGPRVPRLEFAMGSGKTFTITAENAGGANIYIQSASLDGQPLASPLIRHADIVGGRTLAFVMGPVPSAWGTGGDFDLPGMRELVQPVGGWSVAAGTAPLADAATSSPVLGNGSGSVENTGISAGFSPVTLEQAGDSLSLCTSLELSGLPSDGSASDSITWGLFHSGGQPGTSGWTGYLQATDAASNPARGFWKKAVGNSSAYHSTSGADPLASYSLPVSALKDGTFRLMLTLTRNAGAGLDYYAALLDEADGSLRVAFTGSDPMPATYTFDRAGFRCGTGLAATRIAFSGCHATARRATYAGRALVVPEGGTFYQNGERLDLAGLVNHGTVEVTGGVLAVTGDIQNGGVLRLKNGAEVSASGTFQNTGTLDQISSLAPLPANFSNSGVILQVQSLAPSVTVQGTMVTLSCLGHPGHTYQFQRDSSGTLAGPWEDIGPKFYGTGGYIVWQIAGQSGNSGRSFFRVLPDP